MRSKKPRKQRKQLFNAPLHKKRRWIASHLAENLLLKYDRRSMPVIKGDTVKVMRGSFKGHEDKITQVNVKRRSVEIEGVTMLKADGKKIAKPVHPSNLLITKMNLTDNWRREKLEHGLPEETKKEIEKEAEEQLKEMELEKQRELEEKEREEREKEIEEAEAKEETKETSEEKSSKETKKPETPVKPEKKTTKKKEEKKTDEKKETPKKKTTKKTPAKKKTTKKKETKK